MPIQTINGQPTYQPYNMSYQQAYQTAFGQDYTKKNRGDLSGTSAYALGFLSQQQQNAHELELWKLQNEYNLPVNQMQRWQDAGLNPNLIYSQQNTAGPIQASAPIAPKPTNFQGQNRINTANAVLNGVKSLFSSATSALESYRNFYDYVNYGESMRDFQKQMMGYQADIMSETAPAEKAKQAFYNYFFGSGVPFGSPAQLQAQANLSKSLQDVQYTKALTDLTPFQRQQYVSNIALTEAGILKTNAETGRIEVDKGRLKALISQINMETAKGKYELNYLLPQRYNIGEYERTALMPLRFLGANADLKLKGLVGENKGLINSSILGRNPWLKIHTGYDWLDNMLMYGAQKGDLLLDNYLNSLFE